MNAEEFGVFIASCRKEQNMTQLQLAKLLNVCDKAVSRWERGRGFPEITLLPALAEALGISMTELLECEKGSRLSDPVKDEDDTIIQALEIASTQIREAKIKCWVAWIMLMILSVFGTIISCYYINDILIRAVFITILIWAGYSVSALLGTLLRKV